MGRLLRDTLLDYLGAVLKHRAQSPLPELCAAACNDLADTLTTDGHSPADRQEADYMRNLAQYFKRAPKAPEYTCDDAEWYTVPPKELPGKLVQSVAEGMEDGEKYTRIFFTDGSMVEFFEEFKLDLPTAEEHFADGSVEPIEPVEPATPSNELTTDLPTIWAVSSLLGVAGLDRLYGSVGGLLPVDASRTNSSKRRNHQASVKRSWSTLSACSIPSATLWP